MVSCGITMKSVLVAIVLMTLMESGLSAEKLATCCEKVTRDEIKEPILGFLVQSKTAPPCVNAVILQTEKGLFCAHPGTPWVRATIKAIMNDKRQKAASPSASPSPVSLLSMITSSAPPSSSSSS